MARSEATRPLPYADSWVPHLVLPKEAEHAEKWGISGRLFRRAQNLGPSYYPGKSWLRFELLWLHFPIFSLYYFSAWPALPFIYKVFSDVIALNVQSRVLPFCLRTGFLLKSAEKRAQSVGRACVHPRAGLCLWPFLSVGEHGWETIGRK